MKKIMCISMEPEMYHKLHTVCMMRNYIDANKRISITGIINDALDEYFWNHNEEIQKLTDEYHDKGGCANI